MQRLDLGLVTAEVAGIVAAVRDDQLGDPTPCEGTPVAGLLDHLAGLTTAFRMAAEKQPLSGGPQFSAEQLDPEWRRVLPERLAALAAAWREPAAWEGVTEVAGVTLPAGMMGVIALDEVLVHGWDIAVATAQRYEPDPAAVAVCRDFVAGSGELRDQQFGPVVPVPDDAPLLDRLLGLTGRDPSWRPPG